MEANGLVQEITKIISDITELDVEYIIENRSANFFEELEIDSLLALEILSSMEKKYKIEIPEERMPELVSLNATVKLVQEFILATSN